MLPAHSHCITNVLNHELLFNVSVSSFVGLMSLLLTSQSTTSPVLVIMRLYITQHELTPGQGNDTPQKDETTMEEDNSGLFCMIHGWLSSRYRVSGFLLPPKILCVIAFINQSEYKSRLCCHNVLHFSFQEKGLWSRHRSREDQELLILPALRQIGTSVLTVRSVSSVAFQGTASQNCPLASRKS